MFPLRDRNPTELTPLVTILFIVANVAAFLVLQGGGPMMAERQFVESLCRFGTIPGELTGALRPGETVSFGPYRCSLGGLAWGTVLTSMFLHGGWLHLVGNMWFLWVFGNNIEDSMGHLRFVAFYLLCGIAASLAHVFTTASSGVPTVGASGAISGVMGAYLLLYPRVRVDTLLFFFIFIRIIPLPAWFMLGYWFFIQLVAGGMTPAGGGGGVAYWAHVGGFVAGLVLIKLFEKEELVGAKQSGRKLSREEVRRVEWW